MWLDEVAVNEFKKMYLEFYGIELDDQLAHDMSTGLVNFVKAVFGKNLPDKSFMASLTKTNQTTNNLGAFRQIGQVF